MKDLVKTTKLSGIIAECMYENLCDDAHITEILFDDYAQCIHITVTSGVDSKTLKLLGTKFGDDNPTVVCGPDDTVKIIVLNNRENLHISNPQITVKISNNKAK